MRAVDTNREDRRAARRAALRSKLLCAVTELLRTGQTYAELKVNDIVNQAGVSRSSFYMHFRDKGQLLEEFVSDVMGELIEVSTRWWSLGPAPSKDDVREALRVVILTYWQHGPLMIAASDAAAFDSQVRSAFESTMADGRRGLAAFILHTRDGRDRQHSPEVDAEMLAGWLVWMAERGLSKLLVDNSDARVAALVDSLTYVVWQTVYA